MIRNKNEDDFTKRKYSFALDNLGNLIHISDACEGVRYYCVNSGCGEMLAAALDKEKSKVNRYFRHKPQNINCVETYEHKVAKIIIEQMIETQQHLYLSYPCSKCHYGKVDVDITTQIKKAKQEQFYPYTSYRADVVGYSDDEKRSIYFEVLKTHRVEQIKKEGIFAHHWVELKAEQILQKYEDFKSNKDFKLDVEAHGQCRKAMLCKACSDKKRSDENIILNFIDALKTKDTYNNPIRFTVYCEFCGTVTEDSNVLRLKTSRGYIEEKLEDFYKVKLHGKVKGVEKSIVFSLRKFTLNDRVNLNINKQTPIVYLYDIHNIEALKKNNNWWLHDMSKGAKRCSLCMESEKQIKYEKDLIKRFSAIFKQDGISEKVKLEWYFDAMLSHSISLKHNERAIINDLVFLIKNQNFIFAPHHKKKYGFNFDGNESYRFYQAVVAKFANSKFYMYEMFSDDSIDARVILDYIKKNLSKSDRIKIWNKTKGDLIQQAKLKGSKQWRDIVIDYLLFDCGKLLDLDDW